MRAFAQRSNAPRTASARARLLGRARFGERQEENPAFRLQRTVGNQAVQRLLRAGAGDFAAPLPAQSASSASAKGEVADEEQLFNSVKGEEGEGTKGEGESASKGESKKVKKTELGAPTAGECGAYSWKVRFSVENADDSTTGYIVQKIDVKYNRTDCDGKDKPVTGMGTFPYWEAWGVRGGKVFIGDTADAHNADTYSDRTMGDGTKGSIVIKGTPEFFPNVTLPAHMKANNPDTQAGSLRSSTTDPALAGGTGSISHNLTANWNCCGAADKKTTFTDKT